jgi:hypothetical protein
VGAEIFHADVQTGEEASGQTDGKTQMTKLKAAFRNFAKALKNLREIIE